MYIFLSQEPAGIQPIELRHGDVRHDNIWFSPFCDLEQLPPVSSGADELEFIAQLFNVANRANYNVPNNNITATTFGQSTSILPNINAPSRQVEIAVRYRF